jgi:NAD(P)-dependent dehydrogenase (short-subunit alcohol dehydrogenase family)
MSTTAENSPSDGILASFGLPGRVALVTGASSGLGAGFAVALAEAGADVVLGARRLEGLERTAAVIETLGRRSLSVRTDVTDPLQCEAMVAAAMERFARVDVLVNNAGVTSVVPAVKEHPDDFRRVVDVNLMGAYWMAQACARVMLPGSAIVNVSSVLGLIKSVIPQAAYAASKAGLNGLTRDLSQQWSRRLGIRVNSVAPGFVATDMISQMPPATLDRFLSGTCLGRVGTQRELDAAVVFLASPASSYITGSTLAVDGGMSGH